MSYPLLPMKLKRLAWLGCVLCLLAAHAAAQANSPRHRILIDRSGSMEGFFTTSQIQNVQSLLQNLSGAQSDAYYFIDTDLVPVSQAPPNFGADTYLRNALDRALAQPPAPAILWLITDNQPSVGNQTDSDKDIAQFYDRLRSDAIKRLYFFPLKLDFKGKLYREDGHALLTPNYEGKRGLLVYALLLDAQAQDEFERVTKEFQSRFQPAGASELQRILIKPLQQDTITAELTDGNKFHIANDTVTGDFAEGARINGDFNIKLTSKLGQMRISRGDVQAAALNFQTGDFTESKLTPTLDPNFIDDFRPANEPQKEHNIKVKFDADGVHIRRNLVSWWNCITHNRGDITGHIKMTINVPGQNFDVVTSLTNEFSTSRDIYNDASANTQSRIYKLDELVKRMLPEQQVNIQPRIGNSTDGLIPVRLTVQYPKWPAFALVVLIIALLLLALFAFRLFGRGQTYRLTWDNGNYRACPDFRLWPLVGQRVELDNRTAATIKKSLAGIRVRAVNGYTVDDTKSRLVNPGGTDFNVSQAADGTGLTFYFSSVTAAFGGGPAARADGDDIFGDVPYANANGDGASTLAGGTASAPPIRKPTTGRIGGSDGSGSAGTTTTDDNSPVNLADLFS